MDKKAKNILFKTYWKNGWIDANQRQITVADFEYAKSKGLMFEPLTISHDQCLDRILRYFQQLQLTKLQQRFK